MTEPERGRAIHQESQCLAPGFVCCYMSFKAHVWARWPNLLLLSSRKEGRLSDKDTYWLGAVSQSCRRTRTGSASQRPTLSVSAYCDRMEKKRLGGASLFFRGGAAISDKQAASPPPSTQQTGNNYFDPYFTNSAIRLFEDCSLMPSV